MNAIKDAIKSGRTVVGTTVTPNVDVSILAEAGYVFLLFDTQHSGWEIKQLQPSIQTMRGKQAAPLVCVGAKLSHQMCFASSPETLASASTTSCSVRPLARRLLSAGVYRGARGEEKASDYAPAWGGRADAPVEQPQPERGGGGLKLALADSSQ